MTLAYVRATGVIRTRSEPVFPDVAVLPTSLTRFPTNPLHRSRGRAGTMRASVSVT
jgi:hypothetical protein